MPDTDDRLIERGRELAATKPVPEQVAAACGFDYDLELDSFGDRLEVWVGGKRFAPDTDPVAAEHAMTAWAILKGVHPRLEYSPISQEWHCWAVNDNGLSVGSGLGDFCTAICPRHHPSGETKCPVTLKY